MGVDGSSSDSDGIQISNASSPTSPIGKLSNKNNNKAQSVNSATVYLPNRTPFTV